MCVGGCSPAWASQSPADEDVPGVPGRLQVGADGGAEDPRLRGWWRGRLGLSRPEQLGLFEQGGAIAQLDELEGEGGEDELGDQSDSAGPAQRFHIPRRGV